MWDVVCDCGEQRTVLGNSLTTGNTVSCGCLQKEKAKTNIKILNKNQWSDDAFILSIKSNVKKRFTTHGARCRESPDPLYERWHAMKCRCTGVSSYKRKHITVCSEWESSYECFKEWALSHGYKRGMHLDRIDNGKNYCPENCQFLSPEEHYKKTGRENTKRLRGDK